MYSLLYSVLAICIWLGTLGISVAMQYYEMSTTHISSAIIIGGLITLVISAKISGIIDVIKNN